MTADFKKVLVLAPHTDDGESGCGGTISRFLKEGKQVFQVVFSWAEESVPEGFPKDILKTEVRQATEILGLPKENLILFDYPVRNFSSHRQKILEDMVKLNKEIEPDLVFLPSTFDTHQDHQVICQEGFRAFKKTSILGYEFPWNNIRFNAGTFVSLSEDNVLKKIEALKCYKSQARKSYMSDDFLKGLAKIRGVQIGVPYAEAYESVRWILK